MQGKLGRRYDRPIGNTRPHRIYFGKPEVDSAGKQGKDYKSKINKKQSITFSKLYTGSE
jgi:hypothetical protein